MSGCQLNILISELTIIILSSQQNIQFLPTIYPVVNRLGQYIQLLTGYVNISSC